jgi:hypothetical protein
MLTLQRVTCIGEESEWIFEEARGVRWWPGCVNNNYQKENNVVRHVVWQIASSMVLARFKWNQLPNVEHFVRVIQINHNSTIDMLACHINQLVGATSGFGKYSGSVLMEREGLSHPPNMCEELSTRFHRGCHDQWWLDVIGRWIASAP